jgi:hypothetical protein
MKNKWTTEEDNFLKENYEKYGAKWVSNELNRSINTVRAKASLNDLKYINIDIKYEENNLKNIINSSKNYRECVKKLGLTLTGNNNITLKKYINLYNINTSHFINENNFKTKIDLKNILIINSDYNRVQLKERLYKEGLKQRCCELCGQGEEWNGKKMSLILDHKNGVNNDNRIENLRIVCPNCNATLDTHCGKNRSKKNIKKIEYGFNVDDDVNFRNIQTKEKIHAQFNNRKIKERPDKEVLLNEIERLGYSGTGRKYGVSDNAIRKWEKNYIKIKG